MAGNKQLVAVFLMCIAVVAALHLQKADAAVTNDGYNECFKKCHSDCFQNGATSNGYTYCEMKCDSECSRAVLDRYKNRNMQL